MGTTVEATDLTDANPTNRDAAAVITPRGTHSTAATPPSATAAGPNRHTRDARKPAPRRNRRFDRVSALGVGSARWIVAASAIGLTALSVALAAPASAHGSHDGGDTRHHHTSTSAVHQQADGVDRSSTSAASETHNAAVDPPVSNQPTGSMPLLPPGLPGHDKCKAQRDGVPGPPWCTDPSAGWVQSTLHRTDASFPTLSGAEATAATGRAAVGQGAVHAHFHIGRLN
jgi:hypothetical protein